MELHRAVDEFGHKFRRSLSKIIEKGRTQAVFETTATSHADKQGHNHTMIVHEIAKDFTSGGDQKIIRAIGRTAAVNAAVLVTTLTGGAGGAAGLLAGGALTAKRLGDGVQQEDEREVAKSLAVWGSATTASIVGQAVTGAVLLGVTGASLPVAGAVAFGVGCVSGISVGALSEWGVERVLGETCDQDDDESYEALNER